MLRAKWKCRECDWVGHEFLQAANPFEPTATLCGCPKCKMAESLVAACDEPGCTKDGTCGTPIPGGYRTTCYAHRPAS